MAAIIFRRGITKLAAIFQPPGPVKQLDYAGLQQLVVDARAELEKVSREAVDALAGKQVTFQIGVLILALYGMILVL